jgi:hypothetical protein
MRRSKVLGLPPQLVLPGIREKLLIENIIDVFYEISYLNEDVNCTESSPSVSIPWCLRKTTFMLDNLSK